MVSADSIEKPFKGPSGLPNKFLEQIQSKGYYGFYPNENWTPNVNLYETDSTYMVCVDLSGVEKQKIDIEVVDRQLTLRGNRAVPSCAETEGDGHSQRVKIHLMEIDHGAFARDVELPSDIQRDKINARYENGLLWIQIPKHG